MHLLPKRLGQAPSRLIARKNLTKYLIFAPFAPFLNILGLSTYFDVLTGANKDLSLSDNGLSGKLSAKADNTRFLLTKA